MRSRAVLVGIVAGLVTGVGVLAPVAASGAGATECGNADLRASYRASDAAAGSRYGDLVLRNVSDRTCWVRGYGGVSYVGGGDGTQVGAPARRDAGKARRVVLAPGERATSRVREVVAADYPRTTCRPRRVDGFRVHVPDATASQFVAHRTTGCANPRVRLLSQRPYRAA